MEVLKMFIVDQRLIHNPAMTTPTTILYLTVCGKYFLKKRSATGQCEIELLEEISALEAEKLIAN